ncbi:response regulator receiver and ANTAR domain protein [Ruminiclostridium sufflavum DSM 19573]|uniref:Stage 0 sporulation protein A homolog n=1 Tax=Ruminiclostridium sufflavum DSM 19573 TaxID=1121337 RepID=A0A318XHI8_9FIRM|nr:ANTAR domain-containing protein [Ruminiclostridium sufflavum]PYG86660.1 response regulator receiver and ANTAR domain protein [Ruminiclostridium sufflavum DSM 19573]
MNARGVFIVCSKPELIKDLRALMLQQGYSSVEYALSASEARRKLDYFEPGLILVNAPLQDELGVELVLDIADKTDAGIIVLSRHEHLAEMQYKLERVGALVLPKPISRTILIQTAKFAVQSRKSIKGLKLQNDDLEKRIQDRKIVEKAKWILVEKMNMTEPQAHRYIQKRAMDLRISQLKVAEEIFNSF